MSEYIKKKEGNNRNIYKRIIEQQHRLINAFADTLKAA